MLEQIQALQLTECQDMERKIANKIIGVMLDSGYTITIDNGNDITIRQSSNKEDILAGMFLTDEDKILVSHKDGNSRGYIWLVYGNRGWDVIHNYSNSLEVILNPVHDLVDTMFINAD